MPASRVFYTGKLGLGGHQVAVRTANRAGLRRCGSGWRVMPLPAPRGLHPAGRPACWYPPHLDSTGHPMRWDWQIGRVTPLQRTGARAVDIYDIDGFLTTPAEVARSTPAGRRARWRTRRPSATWTWPGRTTGRTASPGSSSRPPRSGNVYFGYPQERWVDFRQLDALKPMLRRADRDVRAEGVRRGRAR